MQISPEELTALLEVSKAYAIRAHARQHAKDAKLKVEEAKVGLANFGMYEDCGSFYQSEFDAAEGIFKAAVQTEINSECAYKRERLTAIENHPSLEGLISQFIYVKQGKDGQVVKNAPVAPNRG